MKVTILKKRDRETGKSWFDIYFDKKFQVRCWNKQQVKSYLNICKECNYIFCNA